MIDFNKELTEYIIGYNRTFNEIIPFTKLSVDITNEQLIDAVKQSINCKQNLLPDIFGYDV